MEAGSSLPIHNKGSIILVQETRIADPGDAYDSAAGQASAATEVRSTAEEERKSSGDSHVY